MNKGLNFTGERFVPGAAGEIWYEHWHRYHFAAKLVGGREVLDVACGAGYGSALLARGAQRVPEVARLRLCRWPAVTDEQEIARPSCERYRRDAEREVAGPTDNLAQIPARQQIEIGLFGKKCQAPLT